MLARSPKKRFSQLPLHALDDSSFTSLQLRLLGKVIWHCRRSGKCWTRLNRLAAELDCHHTNVSDAFSVLVRRGYLIRERSKKDGRLFVYRLTDLGKSFALGQTISESRLPLGKRSRRPQQQNSFDDQHVVGDGDAPNRVYEIVEERESINSALACALKQTAETESDESKQGLRHLNDLLGAQFKEDRAVDAEWRRACRSKARTVSLDDMIDAVLAKCPNADRDYLRRTFERRFALYRPRRRRLRVSKDTKIVSNDTARPST